MPKTKLQKFIFGLIMSYSMAIGMEIYNTAIKMGFNLNTGSFSTMTNSVFPAALQEASFMGLIVLLCSSLWGNRIGQQFADRHANPTTDNPYFYRLLRQAGTVSIMCPTMSLIASILFNIILAQASIAQLPAIWIGTIIKNLPMAFFWNMYIAAPFTHWLFNKIFLAHRPKSIAG